MLNDLQTIGAVILAAGNSRRFGEADKRLAPLQGGKPLLQTCIDVCAEAIEQFVVVLNTNDAEHTDFVNFRTGRPVYTGPKEPGMGDSLARGVQAMADCDAILVLLGDMPFIKTQTLRRVAALSRPNVIVVPRYRGVKGHPVAFPQAFFPQLVRLKGDTGAKMILRRHASRCRYFECDDRGVLLDIDTRDQLEAVQ